MRECKTKHRVSTKLRPPVGLILQDTDPHRFLGQSSSSCILSACHQVACGLIKGQDGMESSASALLWAAQASVMAASTSELVRAQAFGPMLPQLVSSEAH